MSGGNKTDDMMQDYEESYLMDFMSDPFAVFPEEAVRRAAITTLSNPNVMQDTTGRAEYFEEYFFDDMMDTLSFQETGQTLDDLAAEAMADQTGVQRTETEEIMREELIDHFDDQMENIFEETESPLGGEGYQDLLTTFSQSMGSGKFRLGAPYQGYKSVVEYEDDRMYIPKSYNCILQIIKKLYPKAVEKVSTKLDPYGITMRTCRRILKEVGVECPPFYRPDYKNPEKFVPVSKKKVTHTHRIYIVPTDQIHYYHAVLIKPNANYRKLTLSFIVRKFKLAIDKDITIVEKPIFAGGLDQTNSDLPVVVYDFETYDSKMVREFSVRCDNGIKKKLTIRILHPIGVSYQQVYPTLEPPIAIVGTRCHYELIDIINKKYAQPLDDKGKPIGKNKVYMYAYNAGRFDTLFFKRLHNVNFRREIKVGGGVKLLEMQTRSTIKGTPSPHPVISLRDLKDFFPSMHLGAALKSFNCPQKLDLDIGGKSIDWFRANEALWVPYMNQDSAVIAELCMKLNTYIHKFGYDMRDTITISGMAWKLLLKTCYNVNKVKIPNHVSLSRFIRDGIYGGRVILWKRKFDSKIDKDELISLDANSLYPSAMYLYYYPCGTMKLIKNEAHMIDLLMREKKLFMAEVTVKVPNHRCPLFPYRTPKKKGSSPKLIYKCGEMTGVYTSVELMDLMHDGGSIVKFHRGVYWTKKAKIFRNLIDYLYRERKKLKKDKNDFQSVIKIVLNSFYGKTMEKIDSQTVFSNSPDPKKTKHYNTFHSKPLPNGQFEQHFTINNYRETKPFHLSAFILSYSRHIMNNLMRVVGKENIYYSDTDSVYIKRSAAGKLGPEFLHNELGGFKNDYGEGIYIDESIFVGIKRYLMHFKDENVYDDESKRKRQYKAKFNGLSFAYEMKKQEVKPPDTNCTELHSQMSVDTNEVQPEYITDWRSTVIYSYKDEHPRAPSPDYDPIREGKEQPVRLTNRKILANYIGGDDISEEGFDEYGTLKAFYEDIYKDEYYIDKRGRTRKKRSKALKQECWRRLKDGVQIYRDDHFYTAGMAGRGSFKDDVFVPIGYDVSKPIDKEVRTTLDLVSFFKKSSGIVKHEYSVNKHGVFSALPIVSTKTCRLKKSLVKDTGFRTSFVIDKKDNIFNWKQKKVKDLEGNMTPVDVFYETNEYGPIKGKMVDVENYDLLIACKGGERYPLSAKIDPKTYKWFQKYIAYFLHCKPLPKDASDEVIKKRKRITWMMKELYEAINT